VRLEHQVKAIRVVMAPQTRPFGVVEVVVAQVPPDKMEPQP
jgi:hypothetical protein